MCVSTKVWNWKRSQLDLRQMLLEADHARYRLCVQLGLCLGQPFNLHSGTEEVPGQEHKCQNPVASATDDHCLQADDPDSDLTLFRTQWGTCSGEWGTNSESAKPQEDTFHPLMYWEGDRKNP